MKVLAYVGSYRNNKSLSLKITKFLMDELSCYDKNLEFKILMPAQLNIRNCIGCTNCFLTGDCAFVDDINLVINEMSSSDLIILVSPVYFHQVSGNVKTLIDRMSYLAHTLRYTGKLGISISVSDTNGNKQVNEYLREVLESLGMSILSQLSFETSGMSDLAIKSIIRMNTKKIIKKISNEEYEISANQDIFFKNYRKQLLNSPDYYEKKYWADNEYFNFTNFYDLFRNKTKRNLLNGDKAPIIQREVRE